MRLLSGLSGTLGLVRMEGDIATGFGMLGMNLATRLCVYYSRVAFTFRDMASTTSTI